MAEIRIGYFVEDIRHESFVKSLVARIAGEMGLPPETLRPTVWNATGGRGAVLRSLERFLRDVSGESQSPLDVLIVAIDGNCSTYLEQRRLIDEAAQRSGYPRKAVCAVPDPHIERWYLADPDGFQRALGAANVPPLPAYKCERGVYKQALRQAIGQVGVVPPLGGAEYGADIAETLDLFAAGKADSGLKHFVRDLRAALAPFAAGHKQET